jgi:hypothetical protein
MHHSLVCILFCSSTYLNVIIYRAKADADKTNLKLSKFILLRRCPSFEKAKKDLGEMKGVVKSVEAVNGRLLVVADSGEKLELKVLTIY